MHSKSDNIETMIKDEVKKELFKWIQNRYPNNLEEPMKGRITAFDYIHLLYYKYHKINLNCGWTIYRFS